MSEVPALLTLAGGIVLVVVGAEFFLDGVLAVASRLGVSAFLLTAIVSGFELENLAAGIAANARGLTGRRRAPSSAGPPSWRSASRASPRSWRRSGPGCRARPSPGPWSRRCP